MRSQSFHCPAVRASEAINHSPSNIEASFTIFSAAVNFIFIDVIIIDFFKNKNTLLKIIKQ